MVFPGKRSTGCHVCRRRKVKCDGAKPACQNCVSRGVGCTGYPDSFAFREYTTAGDESKAKMTVKKPVESNSNSNSPGQIEPAEEEYAANSAMEVRCPSPRLRSGPALSLEWQSVCYFVHQHVMRVNRSPCRGCLAFFPEMYAENGDDPCLRHAILSVTYLALFNTSRVNQLYVNARKHYGSAMKSLVAELQSSETAIRDEVFAASLFLSMFTDLAGDSDSLNPHIPGAYSLLQLRDRLQLNSKYGRELFGWAVTQVQTQAIAHHEFRYASLPQSIRMMYKPDNIYRAGIVIGMISEFCRSISEMRTSLENTCISPNVKESIHRLLEQAHYFIDEIDTWHDKVPGHWKRQYQLTYGEELVEAPPVERDQWTTCYLATVNCAQITFYTQIIEFCEYLGTRGISISDPIGFDEPVEPFVGIETRIQNLVKMICSTVTFALGHLGPDGVFYPSPDTKLANGYILRYPMRMVVSCPYASADQVSLCRQGLRYVGLTIVSDRN